MLLALLPPLSALACAPRTSVHLGLTPNERKAIAERQAAEAQEQKAQEQNTQGQQAQDEDAPTEEPKQAPEPDPGDGTNEEPAADAPTIPEPPPAPDCRYVYPLEHPVVGGSEFISGFGAVRDGGDRWHLGVDLAAPRMTPVVAVRDGVVTTVHSEGERCCWLAIRHDDGWSSRYIHLNNDTLGTDDGLGAGVRPGLEEGDRVTQGELIGWIGDSGNAEPGVPHLHFELRTPAGVAIDALPSIQAAAARLPTAFPDAEERPRFDGPFADDDGHPAEPLLETVASWGMPVWCDDHGMRACPDQPATRVGMIEWITFLAGEAPSGAREVFADDPPPRMEASDPEAITRLEDCIGPVLCDQPITRDELAALVVATTDSSTSRLPEAALETLHEVGQVDRCLVTEAEPLIGRGDALQMLLRAFGYLPTPPCGRLS